MPNLTHYAAAPPNSLAHVTGGAEVPVFCKTGETYYAVDTTGPPTLYICTGRDTWQAVGGTGGTMDVENFAISANMLVTRAESIELQLARQANEIHNVGLLFGVSILIVAIFLIGLIGLLQQIRDALRGIAAHQDTLNKHLNTLTMEVQSTGYQLREGMIKVKVQKGG